MTVGRSEQANTLEVESDLKVRSTVGCVPSVTFLRSLSAPESGRKEGRKNKSPAVSPDQRGGRDNNNCLGHSHANIRTLCAQPLI